MLIKKNKYKDQMCNVCRRYLYKRTKCTTFFFVWDQTSKYQDHFATNPYHVEPQVLFSLPTVARINVSTDDVAVFHKL